MNIKRILLALTVLIIISGKSTAQPVDTAYATILQNKINELKTANNLVGISAAVFIPGYDVWTGTAGISEKNIPVNDSMIFAAGSITKSFISAIILQLCDEGLLSLNDTVGRWITGYPNINGSIPIRVLLNHRSGIYNYTDNPQFLSAVQSNYNRIWEPEEALQYILAPYFAPGTGWRYSNSNYTILSIIIEAVTGNELRNELRNRIYNRFNYGETFLEVFDTVSFTYAHNWVDLNSDGILDDAFSIPRTSIYSATIGAGGIMSRPENLSRWGYDLFTSGMVSDSLLNQMTQFTNVNLSGANGYGLGMCRFNVNGRTCYGHGGNIFGYASIFMYYPEQRIGIAIMMNKDIVTGGIGISFMNTVIANSPVGITTSSTEIPDKFILHQNYPNPFNPSTKIKFNLPESGNVSLRIYDILGREAAELVNEKLNAGIYEFDWNASNFTSGIYFYTLTTENFRDTKKLILSK